MSPCVCFKLSLDPGDGAATGTSRRSRTAFYEKDHLDHRFDSQDADWAAYGLPNYSKLTGQDFLMGHQHVQHHKGGAHCSRDFHEFCSNGFDYVCDTTEPTLHWTKDCGVMYYFSPAAGTGWHTYKYMLGTPPAECKPGEHCDACADPTGEVACTVKLHGGDCKEWPEASAARLPVSKVAFLLDLHGATVLRSVMVALRAEVGATCRAHPRR